MRFACASTNERTSEAECTYQGKKNVFKKFYLKKMLWSSPRGCIFSMKTLHLWTNQNAPFFTGESK